MQNNSLLQHSSARLNECLETIKQEFDTVLHDSNLLKNQREDYEGKRARSPCHPSHTDFPFN